MRELVLAFLIFLFICLAYSMKVKKSPDALVYVVESQPEAKYIHPSHGDAYEGGTCGDVRYESKPYESHDKCMASCGECNAYSTEPVLREMTFYNNLYDKEHSYECDAETALPFARVFDK